MSANQDFFTAAADGAGLASPPPENDADCLSIAPILAGARARGVADALEMLGVAAILLGADGDVLFANEQARSLLIPHLRIAGERLATTDKSRQAALSRLIEAASAGSNGAAGSLVLRRGDGVPALRLQATPIADDDPFQLLRAVLLLDRGG